MYRLLRGIWQPDPEQGLAPPHDPQPHLAVGLCDLGGFGKQKMVDRNHVVKEPDSQCNELFQPIPVEPDLAGRPCLEHARQVDGAQVAALKWQQGQFPAGVGGLKRPQARHRVAAVHGIEEDKARVARVPGLVAEGLPDFTGLEPARGFPGAGVDQLPRFPFFNSFHIAV